MALDVLQEIQLGRRGYNQEWRNLDITHKKNNYASQQAELSLVCQDDTRLWLWSEACPCLLPEGVLLPKRSSICLCCSRTRWLQPPREPVAPHSTQIATCHCHIMWHDHDTVSGKLHIFSPLFSFWKDCSWGISRLQTTKWRVSSLGKNNGVTDTCITARLGVTLHQTKHMKFILCTQYGKDATYHKLSNVSYKPI